ncbi:serine hydrolase [Minwuia thermotolerans]|uniref:Serine hydrolase n=1 Tax=Minwuia thermotolerans TaxID=2056226 RepID=A0A2M9G6W4_9PROT|nr:serine hydrolase [Minwuia thermotolerans]
MSHDWAALREAELTEPGFQSFDRLLAGHVRDGKLAGVIGCVADDSGVRHLFMDGVKDRESGRPMTRDTIFRIYSMTKPVTGVAVMMLRDEGRFELDTPVSDFLPAFRDLKVLQPDGTTRPAKTPMTIRHLLTHTAGLTLPLSYDGPLADMYRNAGLEGMRSSGSLTDIADRLAALPVDFEPGTRWQYSMAQDLLGRIVEVAGGQRFDRFLEERIFRPLGMTDTGFHVPAPKKDRFCSVYPAPDDGTNAPIDRWDDSRFLAPPDFPSGGGGLVSTLDDYLVFARMLMDGGRGLLAAETVAEMTRNHLPGGCDMAAMGVEEFSGDRWEGFGFGLTMSVVADPVKASTGGPAGEYGWSGAAGTFFFNAPEHRATAVLLTQYMPSKAYPLRRPFREAVYEGLAR